MAINSPVTGTFSDTGNSSAIVIHGVGSVDLSFAGTATVNLQREISGGTFINTGDTYTATGAYEIKGDGRNYRLNCSAHTDNVTYRLGQVPSAHQAGR